MTAVGKIFKPVLREDVTERTVRTILGDRGLTGDVTVTAGGPRGMTVTVALSEVDDNEVSQLEELLDGYLFEATVTT